MDTDDTIDRLQYLAERLIDGDKGYSYAGNSIADVPLRLWCFEKAEQRRGFAAEINAIIARLGGDPEDSGSFRGAVHRQWLAFKAEIQEDAAEEVMEECMRGEEAALEDYRDALAEHGMPADVEAVLRRQLAAIEQSYAEVRERERMLDRMD